METNSQPLAYFITWTVYGTFLHGDKRWWRQDGVSKHPRPKLDQWQRDRLKHDILLLNDNHRQIVTNQIQRHCDHRNWKLWVANPRTNHVHVVVTAADYPGDKVRDQLKANCTGGLRRADSAFLGRPVWTTKGDWQCINTQDQLESAIQYAGEAQDRMDRDK